VADEAPGVAGEAFINIASVSACSAVVFFVPSACEQEDNARAATIAELYRSCLKTILN
jgi:hypothetical protein